MNDNVKFGLKNIPKSEKTDKVSEVFSSVAKKYDLMNDLMSLGQHRSVSYTHLTLPTKA